MRALSPFKKPCLLANLLQLVSDSLRPHGLYSAPGSSVHGILQARILEWVAILSCRGSSQPRDRTRFSFTPCTGRWVFAPSVPWLKGQWDSPSSLTPERAAHGLCCIPVQHPRLLCWLQSPPHAEPLAWGWGCLFLKIKRQHNPA